MNTGKNHRVPQIRGWFIGIQETTREMSPEAASQVADSSSYWGRSFSLRVQP
jgi:hypothetical protein